MSLNCATISWWELVDSSNALARIHHGGVEGGFPDQVQPKELRDQVQADLGQYPVVHRHIDQVPLAESGMVVRHPRPAAKRIEAMKPPARPTRREARRRPPNVLLAGWHPQPAEGWSSFRFPGGATTLISLKVFRAAAKPETWNERSFPASRHAKIERHRMTGPSRHPLETRDVAASRGDRPRDDALDIVLRRKSQTIDKHLNCGVDRGRRHLLFPLRGWRDDGLKRALLFGHRCFHFLSIF